MEVTDDIRYRYDRAVTSRGSNWKSLHVPDSSEEPIPLCVSMGCPTTALEFQYRNLDSFPEGFRNWCKNCIEEYKGKESPVREQQGDWTTTDTYKALYSEE